MVEDRPKIFFFFMNNPLAKSKNYSDKTQMCYMTKYTVLETITPNMLLLSYIHTAEKKKQCGDEAKHECWESHVALKAYRRLWPRSRGGSARRRRWETRGWRISWVRSPAAPGDCKGPCGSRGAAATTGTSESDMNNIPEIVFEWTLCADLLFCTWF